MKRIRIDNGIIATLENPNRVLTGHALLIEDGIIRALAPQPSLTDIKARVIDAHGKVVMPGFINSHMHFYSSFARGLTGAARSRDFPEILRHLWWRMDRRLTLDDCYYSTLVAAIEAIRHGTTTIMDHHSSPGAIPGSLGAVAAAIKESGVRACLCYEVSDRGGKEKARSGIEENMRFLGECLRAGEDRIKALFGLHASFTLSDKTLRQCAQAAEKYGAGFHIHCAEDAYDQSTTQRRWGKRVVSRLQEHGILGPQTICAHAVHLVDEEWEILTRTRTAVVHNPQSNLNNAVGVMDLLKALRHGVLVGLGTDAMTNNMLEELRCAIGAQKLLQRDPGAAFSEAVGLLTSNNQEIANRHFARLGQIKEGWAADVICIDYFPPTGMNAVNFPAHLVFGLSQAVVDTTIVGGRILMRNKKLCGLDEEKISGQAQTLSGLLWERF